MFRSRSTRSVAAATTSVVLILGLMAGTTSAADTRDVFFGDGVDGSFVVTPVTTGGAFQFDLTATNQGNQNLSHATLALGDAAAPWTAEAGDSLPSGYSIVQVTTGGVGCTPIVSTATSFSCDVGSLRSGESVTASFVVSVGAASAGPGHVWASFKVAENVNDQGANANTFFARDDFTIGATNSNARSTYLLGQPLTLSTKGETSVAGDKQATTIAVPGVSGGLISIIESDGPTGCPAPCIGQTVSLNVRDGAAFPGSFVRWTLEIRSTTAVPSKGGVIHTLDDGTDVTIPNTKANKCSTAKVVDCFESYVVNKKTGLTTIVFRTATNGAARAW